MKKILTLISLLVLPQVAMALDLINNTTHEVQITVNGNSGKLKPSAIVDYRPPNLKPPFHISATGKTSSGKPFVCKKTIYDANATLIIPEECR